MSAPNNAEQRQEAFCHPEQHEEAHHQEAHDETLGAAAQQHPIVEAAAAAPQPQLSEGEKKALQIHNQARRDVSKSTGHNRPDLVWDNKLEKDATAYAQHLCRANKGLQHSSGDQRPGQGENLAWSKPQGSVEAGSQMWVNEKKNYHGEKIGEGDFGAYGHFTQMIWPSTTRLGIGMARDDDGGVFVVGRYSPPGNFSGKSAYTG
ncbi:hypothetical protein XANCAGTX0491_004702 [Xanthoria calcicola]